MSGFPLQHLFLFCIIFEYFCSLVLGQHRDFLWIFLPLRAPARAHTHTNTHASELRCVAIECRFDCRFDVHCYLFNYFPSSSYYNNICFYMGHLTKMRCSTRCFTRMGVLILHVESWCTACTGLFKSFLIRRRFRVFLKNYANFLNNYHLHTWT